MSIWIAGNDSMKLHYQKRTNLAATYKWRASKTLTTNRLIESRKTLDYKI